MLEKTLKRPLNSKEIKPINPKGKQPWIFTGSSHTLATWMQRADSLEKTLMLGKTEGRRTRGWERKRWLDGNHWLNGHEFEQTPGDSEGHGILVCCSPWGQRVRQNLKDKSKRRNWKLPPQFILTMSIAHSAFHGSTLNFIKSVKCGKEEHTVRLLKELLNPIVLPLHGGI